MNGLDASRGESQAGRLLVVVMHGNREKAKSLGWKARVYGVVIAKKWGEINGKISRQLCSCAGERKRGLLGCGRRKKELKFVFVEQNNVTS